MELPAFVLQISMLIRMLLLMLNALPVLPTQPKILLIIKNANVSLVLTLLGLITGLLIVKDNVIQLELMVKPTPILNVFVPLITLEINALLNAHGQTWEQHQIRILPKPQPPVLVKLVSMELNAKMNANPQKIKKLTVLKTVVNVKILIGLLRQRN